MGDAKPDLKQVLEDFHACETHTERVAFFHKYPQLRTVYRQEHFEMLAGEEKQQADNAAAAAPAV